MSRLLYTLDGKTIKSPPMPIEIQKYNMTKSGRTADSTMQMELVSRKRKFILKYPVITNEEIKIIEDILWDNPSNKLFFPFTYVEDNITKSATVYVGDITKVPARRGPIWYYKDFEIHLIER